MTDPSWHERLLSIEEATAAIPDAHTRAAVALALRELPNEAKIIRRSIPVPRASHAVP